MLLGDATQTHNIDMIETAVMRDNVKVFIIDPWNELDHDRFREESLTEYTGRAIKELKRLAMRLNVHIICVAHPTKMQRRNQAGDVPKPTLYDISDSAHWANKADVGLVVWRQKDMTEIVVSKDVS